LWSDGEERRGCMGTGNRGTWWGEEGDMLKKFKLKLWRILPSVPTNWDGIMWQQHRTYLGDIDIGGKTKLKLNTIISGIVKMDNMLESMVMMRLKEFNYPSLIIFGQF
jgi:hypothetical protein